ncbi:recombinase family protein [Shinella granuli]|uniref:DNA invertase Pin-like site-specific DNA recombinase n=1 Tax=Shinella granuli TaxID=323621 RepID=A0A4R2D4U0_SHIGR|nr:recombinase family protein [Shinella granuli]TCN46339.1 DNA invertase Pin-like site-specific DNA recombinase [Shinella granuli]
MIEKLNEYKGRRVGYLRCSRPDQSLDRQIDALRPHCDELHPESGSAVARKRPVFEKVIDSLQRGDVLVVLDVDRAFRSPIDALLTEETLSRRGVSLHIVNAAVDTSTAEGEFIFTILTAQARLERRHISRRTKEGLAATRQRGTRLGRPPKLTEDQLSAARWQIEGKLATIGAIAAQYKVDPWTLTRSLRRHCQIDHN